MYYHPHLIQDNKALYRHDLGFPSLTDNLNPSKYNHYVSLHYLYTKLATFGISSDILVCPFGC